MELDYSYGRIATIWCPGPIPYVRKLSKRVLVHLSPGNGAAPTVFENAELLEHEQPPPKVQHGVTLLLDFVAGTNPPGFAPPRIGVFDVAPGEAYQGEIRIALPPAAIAAIYQTGDERVPYGLRLAGSFRNVTSLTA